MTEPSGFALWGQCVSLYQVSSAFHRRGHCALTPVCGPGFVRGCHSWDTMSILVCCMEREGLTHPGFRKRKRNPPVKHEAKSDYEFKGVGTATPQARCRSGRVCESSLPGPCVLAQKEKPKERQKNYGKANKICPSDKIKNQTNNNEYISGQCRWAKKKEN